MLLNLPDLIVIFQIFGKHSVILVVWQWFVFLRETLVHLKLLFQKGRQLINHTLKIRVMGKVLYVLLKFLCISGEFLCQYDILLSAELVSKAFELLEIFGFRLTCSLKVRLVIVYGTSDRGQVTLALRSGCMKLHTVQRDRLRDQRLIYGFVLNYGLSILEVHLNNVDRYLLVGRIDKYPLNVEVVKSI